jgi:hypothetical protein
MLELIVEFAELLSINSACVLMSGDKHQQGPVMFLRDCIRESHSNLIAFERRCETL